MAIKTNIAQHGDKVVVRVQGFLDFESNDSFKNQLSTLQMQADSSQIVFDLKDLEFVVSRGIFYFIHTLRDFNRRARYQPRYTNVKTEFKKLIGAFDDTRTFDFWDNTERALFEEPFMKLDH